MVFADGESLETDIVLFSTGIRPRDDLAAKIGLKLGPRGGIVVDSMLLTSDPSIWAIGECALHDGTIYGLVAPGYAMAQAVVHQLQGISASFNGADMSTKLKLMGVDVGSIGDPHGMTPGAHTYVYQNEPEEIYKKIVVSEDKKYLLGAVLVGDAEDYGNLLQLYLNKMELPEHPDDLILPQRDGATTSLFGPASLPETAQVCSCFDVSKGDIIQAIDDGATCLADVKAMTQACTGCGGCTQLVSDLVNHELEARGVEVSTDICEHFPYSRQELFHIVQVEGIKTFDELLAKKGQGHGCDICKPAVASIFADIYNSYAMEADKIGLQDTNDRFLGNLQKNGTYSVIPRVPGGVITPEKLIVIGQVAKKYNLYTKINGGQRIVMFGAQLNDLPAIWEELIAAGFESGQAYAKSLRTVKSCVGSTWCRYGVGDSIAMSIKLENRYKGLRAPHKIKMGASGCTRECAEAQAKDIGVIATENGWNLYVAGNGGTTPRHADLFATDLDEETLFKYIDRFLMFYIRTADRLQRTARWLESLEGGLDYVKDVVINDSLGIAEELEKQMAFIRETYKDDWAEAVNNPEVRAKFRMFVNSDESDPDVLFVKEELTGMYRPATAEEKLQGLGVELRPNLSE